MKVGTQVLTEKAVKIRKYIDDNVSIEKLNFGSVQAVRIGEEDVKIKQALGTQNAFRSVTCNAEEIGMVVNASKTNLLCVSDALNYRPETYIYNNEGNKITSKDTMKILGFHFSSRPTVAEHLDRVMVKMRQRYWSLDHLQSIGFTQEELVRVYQTSILPLADYCCPAYHSLMTDQQDELMERTQIGALRRIYGYDLPSVQLRKKASITTLRERRIKLTDKFAQKCVESDRFKGWFPEATGRQSGRRSERYREFFAKNDRLKNSPLFYMRRRLNNKEGKTYGERNRKYRENFDL